MKLNFIPLITAILPATAVHVCYVLAAQFEHVPWCFPYLDNCVSISATGRQSPEKFVFRAAVMPAAVLLAVYWTLSYEWFKTLGTKLRASNRAMLVFGLIASFGLILYATVLGSIGEAYHLQRRVGVTLFYVFTFLAQLFMTIQIGVILKRHPTLISARAYRSKLTILATVALFGGISLILPVFYDAYNTIDNAFEWGLTMLILAYFFATNFAWRDSGFQASFSVSRR